MTLATKALIASMFGDKPLSDNGERSSFFQTLGQQAEIVEVFDAETCRGGSFRPDAIGVELELAHMSRKSREDDD